MRGLLRKWIGLSLIVVIILSGTVFGEKGKAVITIRCDQDPAPATSEKRWRFEFYFEERGGVGFRLQSYEMIGYNQQGEVQSALNNQDVNKLFDNGYLAAGQKVRRTFGLNQSAEVGAVEYIFRGVDDNGNPVEARIKVRLSQEPPKVAQIEPSSYDTKVLRANANFRLEVAPGIYWVPAAALGTPKLAKEALLANAYNPEALKAQISTLYDAIQYIQAVSLKTVNGNLKTESRINWEHPRPPEFSITKNESNCVGISAVANYLLAGDYEEVGFMEYGRIDGGHIFSYIKNHGKYYVFDLTSYKSDFLRVAVENGVRSSFLSGNRLANIHEVNSLQDYVNYFLEGKSQSRNIVFISYRAEAGMPVGTKKVGSRRVCCFPQDYDLHVLFDAPDDSVAIERVEGPKRATTYK